MSPCWEPRAPTAELACSLARLLPAFSTPDFWDLKPSAGPTLFGMSRQAFLIAFFFLGVSGVGRAQWEMESSGTTADLRGIDNVGGGVAWASGTNGTVLRTEDGGYLWQACAVPPGAEHLDFRGVQAFDANTAIVMSSGKGDLSRLYKTTDGCQTWKLVFTNPYPDGFWDAIRFADSLHGFLFGDPIAVRGTSESRYELEQTFDGGESWVLWEQKISELKASEGSCAFAASNSALFLEDRFDASVALGCQGGSGILLAENSGPGFCDCNPMPPEKEWFNRLIVSLIPSAPFPMEESGGIFSIARNGDVLIAVGGDYRQPESGSQSAAILRYRHWVVPTTQPHGYRSAVAYDAATKTWITVGPNGTDISVDDGKNWRALHPDPALHEAPDADRDWNALSLPFVVGPHGRIGKLNPKALAH